MLVGKQAWWPEAYWFHFHLYTGSKEKEQKVRWGYKISKPILIDILPPARLHLLKSLYLSQQGTKCSDTLAYSLRFSCKPPLNPLGVKRRIDVIISSSYWWLLFITISLASCVPWSLLFSVSHVSQSISSLGTFLSYFICSRATPPSWDVHHSWILSVLCHLLSTHPSWFPMSLFAFFPNTY